MSGEQGQGMADQTGGSVDAIATRQALLSARHARSAEADRALVEALAGAHAATVEGISRLDAIAAEIDSAVTNQAALALDTAVGAREFQKFLVAKQQEISAVVSQARELDGATRAALDNCVSTTQRLPVSRARAVAAVHTSELSAPARPGYCPHHVRAAERRRCLTTGQPPTIKKATRPMPSEARK